MILAVRNSLHRRYQVFPMEDVDAVEPCTKVSSGLSRTDDDPVSRFGRLHKLDGCGKTEGGTRFSYCLWSRIS